MSVKTLTPRVGTNVLEKVVDAARLAPSVHNTQPWTWLVDGDTLDLLADRSRALPLNDPEGRLLAISCGAALHHAVVAASAMALDADVELVPDPERPDLLARLRLRAGQRHHGQDLYDVIPRRCTDRRRFTAWPIADARVDLLTAEVTAWGPVGIHVTDTSMRRRLEMMLERARIVGAQDAVRHAESAAWIDHGPDDGIPRTSVPPVGSRPGEHTHRFLGAHPIESDLDLIPSDGLVVIATSRDDLRAWLTAGQALSALWLRATLEGISVVPLSQVVEYGPTRELLRTELPVRHLEPQVVVRLGWQEIARSDLPRTPRRPLGDVLVSRTQGSRHGQDQQPLVEGTLGNDPTR